MRLKPQQKLDELLEAEIAAEQDALAEQEVPQKMFPYRTNEDLSHKLDIPRDVQGLVELLEEKKLIEKVKPDYDSDPFSSYSASLSLSLFGAAAVLGFAKGELDALSPIALLFPAVPFLGGMVSNYLLIRNRKKKKKEKFQQQKEEDQKKLEPLSQKLSRYETKYSTGDILFLDDKKLGYCLGDVVAEKEERVLRQRYIDGTSYEGYRIYTRTKEIDDEEIISVLMPDRELSVDDLLALGTNTPVLWEGRNYGFFERIGQEDRFVISTQYRLYHPSRQDIYTFQQIENGEIAPRILVPEIKSRIKLEKSRGRKNEI